MSLRPFFLLLCALVLTLGRAAGAQLEPLDPATYRSPSGTAELFVDPSERFGAGPAQYRLSVGGRELWSGARPYTLCQVALADDGTVAGYGYAAGAYGGLDDACIVALWAPDGTARLEQRTPRENGMPSCLAIRGASETGVYLVPESGCFVLRRKPDFDQPERWFAYDLASGAALAPVDPELPLGFAIRTEVVPGTSLVLACARDWKAREHDVRLLDLGGQVVWNGPEQVTLVEVGSARFTLRDGERVLTFEVSSSSEPGSPDAGWHVRLASTHPAPRPPPPEPIPAIALRSLEKIELPCEAKRFVHMVLGPGDRIHAFEPTRGEVYVFDPSGTLLHVCRPEAGDLRLPMHFPTLTVSARGEVLVGRQDAEAPAFVHYSSEGERLGVVGIDDRRWNGLAQPASGRVWNLTGWELVLLGEDGEPERIVQRRADHTWLTSASDAAVAPDGAIALLSRRPPDDEGNGKVDLFAANGEPLRTWTVSADVYRIAFDGRAVAALTLRKALLWFDTSGRLLGRSELPSFASRVFFAAGGRELWLFDGEHALARYAVP